MNTANLQLEGLCLAVAMLNNLLVRKLLADPSAWEEVTFDSLEALPRAFANLQLQTG